MSVYRNKRHSEIILIEKFAKSFVKDIIDSALTLRGKDRFV